uniref:Ig-like domain-containing protein n=1 Tax=Seriola dumerili TaxID=41447 RepID=A0A3B4UJJ0_SERDU
KKIPSNMLGQTVTLTCITSCPLSVNMTYMWYLNSRPLIVPQDQNKYLVLDPVSSQHAGNYSCAVKPGKKSSEKTLTVRSISKKHISAAAAGVCAVLLVIIPLVSLQVKKKHSFQQTYCRTLSHEYRPIGFKCLDSERAEKSHTLQAT